MNTKLAIVLTNMSTKLAKNYHILAVVDMNYCLYHNSSLYKHHSTGLLAPKMQKTNKYQMQQINSKYQNSNKYPNKSNICCSSINYTLAKACVL